jgi:hypothetical protein
MSAPARRQVGASGRIQFQARALDRRRGRISVPKAAREVAFATKTTSPCGTPIPVSLLGQTYRGRPAAIPNDTSSFLQLFDYEHARFIGRKSRTRPKAEPVTKPRKKAAKG